MLSHFSAGTGIDSMIRELTETIKEATDYEGNIEFDTTNPEGTPRKLPTISRLTEMGATTAKS